MSGEGGFNGEGFGDLGAEVRKFNERKLGPENKERDPAIEYLREGSHVEKILKSIRDRDPVRGEIPVTPLDGTDIVVAEIEDIKAYRRLDDDEPASEHLNKLDNIRQTLENITLMERFSYADLTRALNYLRDKRDFMADRYSYTFGEHEVSQQNSDIYENLIQSIYKTMPFAFTIEARLPDYPTLVTSERPLKNLAGKVKEGDLKLADAKEFYDDVQENVKNAAKDARTETPEWQDQMNIAAQIKKFVDDNEDEIYVKGKTPTPLLVSEKDGVVTEIKSYDKQGKSLQNDLKTEDGSHIFVFDPDRSGADMKYLNEVIRLAMWDKRATDALAGMEELMKGPKPTITRSQRNGIFQLLTLYQKDVDTGRIPDKYEDTMRPLRDLVIPKANSAELIDDPKPESVPLEVLPAAA